MITIPEYFAIFILEGEISIFANTTKGIIMLITIPVVNSKFFIDPTHWKNKVEIISADYLYWSRKISDLPFALRKTKLSKVS